MILLKSVAKKWVRNASDLKALENGCRFDSTKGLYVIEWIEKYCRLWEGEFSGKPLILMPWQRDIVMRLFGWVTYSEMFGRWIRRFRRAAIFVPKKNGKSPLIAALGLYLLCGDGEQGQKIYAVARDGKQAEIQMGHAIAMVLKSPLLLKECDVFKSDKRIVHNPTLSWMGIVAGDNKLSQEGLNGSCMVDELHVVSRELMEILNGAGISRSEPFQIGVSTAGNNPESYGREQYDYGRRVNLGLETDQSFFFEAFEAPQTAIVNDESFMALGEKANPSWKIVIDPIEFKDSYFRAKQTPAKFANFLMYRLDRWQQSSNPWLPADAWAECAREFKWRDLCRRDGFGGLDLSRVCDMSAFALALPREDGGIDLIVRLWLPRGYAEKNNHLLPAGNGFLEWAERGFLTLTPGDSMDYGVIRRDIFRLCNSLRVRMHELAFDPMLGEDVTQSLTEGWTDNEGKTICEGLGGERVEFSQNPAGMAEATDVFEGLVVDRLLRHCNNPCLNWMAGNVEVKADADNKRKPTKPGGDVTSVRKIDGIVAAVMACARAQKMREICAYDSRDVFSV